MINYSIIIPHHNIPNLLRRCLQSIPKRNDLQIIVVDDCSDEKYREELQNIELEFKNVVVYYSDTCRGGGAARNIGLEHAIGKYLLFADADDFYNYCVHEILEEYKDETCDMVFFNMNSLDSNTYLPRNRVKHLNIMHEEYEKNPNKTIIHLKYLLGEPVCKLYKNDLIIQNNIQFDQTHIHNDTKFSYLSAYYAKTYKVDHRALYCATDRANSVSKKKTNEAQLTRIKIFAEKNHFLAEHHIPIFDFIMLWPFLIFLEKKDFKHFKECLKIAHRYNFTSTYIFYKLVKYRWHNTKIYRYTMRFIKHFT